jgi:hypothetical protein
MTFIEAKREFEVRYYFWAISEWENEIKAEFPFLRAFKCGAMWETFQVMQKLDKSQQTKLALLKAASNRATVPSSVRSDIFVEKIQTR